MRSREAICSVESTPDKSKRIICFCLGDRAYSAATRLNWRSDTIIASRPICDMAPQIGSNPGILKLRCAALFKISMQSPHIKETKSRHMSDLELYQHVHIAVGSKISPELSQKQKVGGYDAAGKNQRFCPLV